MDPARASALRTAADQFLQDVRDAYPTGHEYQTYKAIMHNYSSRTITVAGVAERVRHTFASRPDLVERFMAIANLPAAASAPSAPPPEPQRRVQYPTMPRAVAASASSSTADFDALARVSYNAARVTYPMTERERAYYFEWTERYAAKCAETGVGMAQYDYAVSQLLHHIVYIRRFDAMDAAAELEIKRGYR